MTDDAADEIAATPTAGSRTLAGIPYRWVAMFVVLFGTFMVVLDTTVVNLGLPALQREYDLGEGVEWIVTSYLAAVGVSQMCSGWLADRFGRRAMFILAMGVFTVASLLCAVSISFEMLVAARVLQGVGGGLLMPIAMAMVYELFEPHERGRALGYFGIAVMAAPAIGPVVGGALVSALSWRWLFLINVPIGVIGVPVAIKLLRDTGYREARRFDTAGLALSGTGLVLFLIGVSQGGLRGWAEPVVIALVVVGVALLAAFVRHCGHTETPLVDLTLFRNRIFTLAMASIALMAISQFSRLVYIPLQLGSVRDVTEFRIGLVMLPSALGMAVTMPIGGRLVDRLGARVPVSVGVSVLGFSFWGLTRLTVTTPLPVIAAILFVGGLGAGLALMSPNIVAMNSVAARSVSQASGLSNVTRQVSAAVGVAALASIFATVQRSDQTGSGPAALDPYRTVFIVAIAMMATSLVLAQFLPGKAKALELQAERRLEMDPALHDDPVAHPAEPI